MTDTDTTTDIVTHVAADMYQHMEWKPLPWFDDVEPEEREFWMRDAAIAIKSTLDWIMDEFPEDHFEEGHCVTEWIFQLWKKVKI